MDRPDLAHTPVPSGSPVESPRPRKATSAGSECGSPQPGQGGAADDDDIGLPSFMQLSPTANLFRLGKGVVKSPSQCGSDDQPQKDGLECTMDGAALRQVHNEMLLEKGITPPPAPPTAKRKGRSPHMDLIGPPDVFAIVATAMADAALSGAVSTRLLRKKIIEMWKELDRGQKAVTLQDIAAAAEDVLERMGTSRLNSKDLQSAFSAPGGMASFLCEKGHRPHMEDFSAVYVSDMHPEVLFAPPEGPQRDVDTSSPGDTYAAVFDGHAGVDAAEWAHGRLHCAIFGHPQYGVGSMETVLKEAFRETDERYARWAAEHEVDSGSCVLAAVHRTKQQELWTAWVGDCAGYLCRGRDDEFDTIPLCTLHNLSNEAEMKGVTDRGGNLLFGGGRLRVEGALMITRSMGDRPFRRSLSQEPEIMLTKLGPNDEFLLLASDGLFEAMSPEEVLEFVRQCKMAIDEWADQQRTVLAAWEKAGRPTRRKGPAFSPSARRNNPWDGDGVQVSRASVSASPKSEGRRWSSGPGGGGGDWGEDDDKVSIPEKLRDAYNCLKRVIEQQDTLREKLESFGDGVDEEALGEVIDLAFFTPGVESVSSYDCIVQGLMAEAFTQKTTGRDNTSIVLLFLQSNLLKEDELKAAEALRGSGDF
eukprot:Hpha_TRINITY_DN16128_c1_g1::TRINITY_DN16128_c1_g1_i1::g.3429::m.3429